MRPSMGSVGDAYDNAMAESFFATLECELLNRRTFRTHAEARMAAFHFIEGFYNPRRPPVQANRDEGMDATKTEQRDNALTRVQEATMSLQG